MMLDWMSWDVYLQVVGIIRLFFGIGVSGGVMKYWCSFVFREEGK